MANNKGREPMKQMDSRIIYVTAPVPLIEYVFVCVRVMTWQQPQLPVTEHVSPRVYTLTNTWFVSLEKKSETLEATAVEISLFLDI